MTIYLDERHGVNPSMEQCFYCLKDVGVVLFGALKPKQREAFKKAGIGDGGAKAPYRVTLSKAPCQECEEHMGKGIVLISVDESKSKDRANPYHTGGWVVVTEDFIRRVFNSETLVENVRSQRVAFVSDDAWELLGLPRGELNETPNS